MKSDKDILQEIAQIEQDSKYLRYGFERDWYRNILFKQGHQWIVWDDSSRRFRAKKLKPWIPTPVTNKFASTLDTLVAMLLRVEPTLQWSPADINDERQRTLAETSTKVLEEVKRVTQMRFWRQELAQWLVYTGNAFLVNMYDSSGGGKMSVPLVQCVQCGYKALPTMFEEGCPECGNSQGNTIATGPDGMPEEETFTTGEIRTEVATPFESFFDFSTTAWRDQSYFLRVKSRPLPYFADTYGSKGRKVQAEHSSTLAEFYASTLAYLSSGAGVTGTGLVADKKETASEYFYTKKPCDEYPDGLYVIASSTEILEKSTLPYKDFSGEPFLPVNHFSFDPVPGSAVGKTVASDLAPKQRQRNELESLIQLITMRTANPVWIVPYGVDVESFSGQPGYVMKVHQLVPGSGNRPERLAGENIPSSIQVWLEKIDSDFEEIAATFDVLKGNTPAGVTAGYAIQLLIERGQSRWGPLFQRWENGFIDWASQVTPMLRDYMPAEQLRKLLGESGDYELARFKNDDMLGYKIEPEAGSIRPRSELSEQAQLDSLLAKGLINIADPSVKAMVLRSVGMAKYDKESDLDIKDAEKEEAAFYEIASANSHISEEALTNHAMFPEDSEVLQSAVRFRPLIDNNPIHLWSHKNFAKSDRFMKLPAVWQAVWYAHVVQTAQRMMEEAQMSMGGSPQVESNAGPPKQGGDQPQPQQGQGGEGGQMPNQVGASPRGGHMTNPAMMEGAGP